jgi:hypothetical protein
MRWREAPAAALVLGACLGASLLASPSQAAELWRSADGAVTVDGGGFLKPYASWLVPPSGLVAATGELGRLFDESRALLPPAEAAELPEVIALPAHVGLMATTLRLQAAARFGEHFGLVTAWQATFLAASSPAFVGAGTSNYLDASQRAPARRLVDFEPLLVDEGGVRLQHNFDLLALTFDSSAVSVIAGRQVLSWGAGRLWNPTDLFSPFAPTDIDREVRRGADALRVTIPLGALSQLDAIWLPQRELVENGAVLRGRTNLLGVDVSLMAAKFVGDLVFGGDLAGDVGPLGLHAEAAYTQPVAGAAVAGPRADAEEEAGEGGFLRAVAGVSARPLESWIVSAEYYFNGFGTTDPDALVRVMQSERVVRGEIFGAGRHYIGVVNAWPVDELWVFSLASIVNLTDPGVLVLPSVEHWLAQRVIVRAGAILPFGAGVDVDVFRRLTPADLFGHSPAFQRAITTFGARSEHGLAPAGAFLQLGAYFD